jgi:O-antigen ligase
LIPKKVTAIFVLLTLSASLLNTSTFGPETYAALFFFIIAASITSFLLQLNLVTQKETLSYPLPIILFGVFCLYIFIHGWLTHTIGIFHYYSATGGLLFLSLQNRRPVNTAIDLSLLHNGVIVIAFIESFIVLLQAIQVLPGFTNSFTATGTWVNPNVTATFLALSLHSIYAAELVKKQRAKTITGIVTILPAIVILQCRTAYIVSLVMLFPLIRPLLTTLISSIFRIKSKKAVPVLLFLGSVLFIVFLLSVKKGSTSGRILIWKNSIDLIEQSPVTGSGFGLFEKNYNEHVANTGSASNGYVKMAYNDFIELSVDGGIIATLLWIAFIVTYIFYCRRNDYSIFPLLSLIIIQLSNFVFQAAPVFALLIVYLALPTTYGHTAKAPSTLPLSNRRVLFYTRKGLAALATVIAAILFIHHVRFAHAFYKVNKVEKQYTAQLAIPEYQQLEDAVYDNAYLHEKAGDAYMKTRQIKKALKEYQAGLQTIYPPSLLIKSGFCYQLQKEYDSSLHYYRLAQNIEPYKYATRHVILRLFEQKKDTANIITTAKDIVNMPVKMESPAVYKMKSYAQNTINKISGQ